MLNDDLPNKLNPHAWERHYYWTKGDEIRTWEQYYNFMKSNKVNQNNFSSRLLFLLYHRRFMELSVLAHEIDRLLDMLSTDCVIHEYALSLLLDVAELLPPQDRPFGKKLDIRAKLSLSPLIQFHSLFALPPLMWFPL